MPPLRFLSFILIAALASWASAATITLNPSADAFVTAGSSNPNAGNATVNYGAAGAMQVSAAGSTKGEIQSLLRFDFAGAKSTFDTTFGAGNWFFQTITLQLGTNFGSQGAQPNNPIFNTINAGLFQIDWLANDSWGEGSGTPALPFEPSNPPTDGVTFASLGSLLRSADRSLGTFSYTPVGNTNPPTVPPALYHLGLNADFLTDAAAGNFVSFRVFAADSSVSYLFNSRSFGGSTKPVLVVEALPEPATAFLCACASPLIATMRRRHATRR